jgi:hypothetical protein
LDSPPVDPGTETAHKGEVLLRDEANDRDEIAAESGGIATKEFSLRRLTQHGLQPGRVETPGVTEVDLVVFSGAAVAGDKRMQRGDRRPSSE